MSTSHRRCAAALVLSVAAGVAGCDVSEPFRVLTDERRVESVIVTPAIANANIADTVQLTARPVGPGDRTVSEAEIVWSTGDPSIARSIGAGRFVVLSAGQAQVFATTRGRRGTAQIVAPR